MEANYLLILFNFMLGDNMKECLKKSPRTLFNLFAIYSCADCINHHNDYYFYLGNNIIQVYYLKDCKLDDDDLFFNMKIIYVLKEIIEKDAYVFWLDDEEELDNVIEYIDGWKMEYLK